MKKFFLTLAVLIGFGIAANARVQIHIETGEYGTYIVMENKGKDCAEVTYQVRLNGQWTPEQILSLYAGEKKYVRACPYGSCPITIYDIKHRVRGCW